MKRLALVLPVLLLAACASDDAASDGSRSPSSPAWASDRSATPRGDAPAGAPTIRTFPPATQAFMKAGLKQFSRQDPQWPSTRGEWLALGARESEFLVQTMWGGLLSAQSSNAPDLVERARHELALIGGPSVPMMAGVLAAGQVGTVWDSESGEQRPVNVDDLQRREASEVLSIVGEPAVPALLDVLDRAEMKSGRRYALQALGNMGDRGGSAGARALIAWAGRSDDALRVEAIHGMRTYHDGGTQSALLAALSDADDLVRQKAAESLAARGDRSVVGAIRDAAGRAQSEGRLAEARRIEKAAQILEKHGR